MPVGNFFEEVVTHDHEKVFSIFMEKAFIVGHIFMVRFSDPFPEGYAFGILVGFVNRLAVILRISI